MTVTVRPDQTERLIQNFAAKIANGPLTYADAGREMSTRGLLNNLRGRRQAAVRSARDRPLAVLLTKGQAGDNP